MLDLRGSRMVRMVVAGVLVALPGVGRAAGPDAGMMAQQVMARAESQAAQEHKNVLVSFSASWCVNCRLYDRLIADRTTGPILGKAFVLADLDTGARAGDKRHANIAGGQAVEDKLGGKDAGYPFLAVTGPDGRLITNSLRPVGGRGENIGYPDAPEEIDWFMEMLRRSAPALSAEEMATVRSWLRAHSTTRR